MGGRKRRDWFLRESETRQDGKERAPEGFGPGSVRRQATKETAGRTGPGPKTGCAEWREGRFTEARRAAGGDRGRADEGGTGPDAAGAPAWGRAVRDWT